MTLLLFSTSCIPAGVEKILGPVLSALAGGKKWGFVLAFQQGFPQADIDCRILVFSGLAENIYFCTGSTTSTKNMSLDFVLS